MSITLTSLVTIKEMLKNEILFKDQIFDLECFNFWLKTVEIRKIYYIDLFSIFNGLYDKKKLEFIYHMLKWFLRQKSQYWKKKKFWKTKHLPPTYPPLFVAFFYQGRVISIEKFILYKTHLRSTFEYVCLLGKKRSKREEDKKDTFLALCFFCKNKSTKNIQLVHFRFLTI